MKLSNEEIQELIIEYQSKVRKAEFQLVEYKQTLADLEKALLKPRSKRVLGTKTASSASITNTTKSSGTAKSTGTRRRGRPAAKKTTAAKSTAKKTTATKAAPKKAAAPKSTARKSGGYRLNEWDELVLATLNDRNKVSVFSDFHEKATAKAKSEGRSVDEKTLYSRINQSLHKLANKRGTLVKVPHEGRGYAYGLSEWKSPSGKGVQKKYQ